MIQMFHVEKAYPGDPPTLQDINLRVEKGEFVFLTGPSGAGKSTLLKLVFAAELPTGGQVLVGGHNVGRLRASGIPYLRRNVGVVFQDFKLLPHRTVAENVAFTLEVLGAPRREVEEKVERMLKRVGLLHKAGSFPPRLSGGEQQRVVIARALVNEPTILLADEPTGNLDPALTVDIMDLLRDVNIRGTTVLVVTHDHSLLERYRSRVLRLERGRLVYDGMGPP
ncbi:MAG: cell division ATP-binding protein FtsE [Deltaproteobacteria bacterium]|nr:cell division ATP-binding protein FtsE [Deltaproteobacteria bacterium]